MREIESEQMTLQRIPVLLALLGLTGLAIGCRQRTPIDYSRYTGYMYRNQAPWVGYVGRDECARCHQENAQTYIQSEMGKSFKPATLSNSDADFDDPQAVYDPNLDFYYQASARGENLYITEFRLAGSDTVHKRVEKIDYIVGSGQHTNSHIYDVNGYLYQMPLTWYVQVGRWDLPPGFKDGANKRFDRAITPECITCHNARPGYIRGTRNRYYHVPSGIDCEQCHGPGELHVRAIEAGEVVDIRTETDSNIVHPGKLPAELQFDVCQRCHLQGTAVTQNGRSFLDFRPGTELSTTINLFLPRYVDSLSAFRMASHPDRLRMSACYQAAGRAADEADWREINIAELGRMTCVTCHNPHLPIDSTKQATYTAACQSCHQSPLVADCSESLAARSAAGDACADCHMPVSGSFDIPHISITDHYIRVVRKGREDAEAGERAFYGLASLTESDPTALEMAEGYLAHYEQFEHRPWFIDSAAVYLHRATEELGEDSLVVPLVRLWFLQGDYDSIRRLARKTEPEAVSDAWTLYRMGESFNYAEMLGQAIDYFERAVRQAPGDLEFRGKLASALGRQGRTEEAMRIYDAMISDNPKFDSAYNDRGFTKAMAGDLDGAERDFLEALALNPDSEQVLGNLASLYLNLGRADDGRRYLVRLTELFPNNPTYAQMLARF